MKEKKRKKRYGVLAFFFMLFFGGGIAFYVYAMTITTEPATNVVAVGKVDVELAMETHDAGTIVPGETAISNQVTVENVGDYPAYIRMFVKKHWTIAQGGVTLSPEGISEQYPELSVDLIDIKLEDGWTKGEPSSSYPGYDCYYYNEVVDTGKRGVDAIHFSDSYKLKAEEIPGDGGITNELLLKFAKDESKVYGYYSVYVEAIQADTCIPLTTMVDGKNVITEWNDTPSTFEPLTDFSMDPSATPNGLVEFVSDDAKITSDSGSEYTFLEIASILPGETAERVVEIQNSAPHESLIYVYAESERDYDTLEPIEKEWLQHLQLLVGREDGKVLYQGSLYKQDSDEPGLSEENPILIGSFPTNTSQKLYVALSCPASWDKGDIRVGVNWIFTSKRALETDEPIITETPSMSPSETSVVVTENPVYDENRTEPPVTQEPVTQEPVTQEPATQEPEKETPNPVEDTEVPGPTDDNLDMPEEPGDGAEISITKEPLVVESEAPVPTQSPKEVILDISEPQQPTNVEVTYPTKTGDVTPIVVWLVLFVVSWMGMIFAVVAWRKSR